MWQTSDARVDWVQGKHVYLNEDRIATKYNSEGNDNTGAEKERTYYYHSDHLGSAQVVTNWNGQIHERLEYTPYGELWIDWKSDSALEDSTPFRFTGKEMDAETGFYYYGARYLDPKTSRWISADPALAEYVPSAPVDEEAKKRNGNLPGMGGVFNYVNLHVYHYAGNNPVKYIDPDGKVNLNFLKKGYLKIIEGRFKIWLGEKLKKAGIASIFLLNPAAPAIIDEAQRIINEGEDSVDEGNKIIDRAWLADSIGRGHAYTEHGKWEFNDLGITGDDTREDVERFVTLVNDTIENNSESKTLLNGRTAYRKDETGIIVIVNPNDPDKGTAFRPEANGRDFKKTFDNLE
jgi:RHS repeat-associated protein